MLQHATFSGWSITPTPLPFSPPMSTCYKTLTDIWDPSTLLALNLHPWLSPSPGEGLRASAPILAIPGMNTIWRARAWRTPPPQPGQRLFAERARQNTPPSHHFSEWKSLLGAPKTRVILGRFRSKFLGVRCSKNFARDGNSWPGAVYSGRPWWTRGCAPRTFCSNWLPRRSRIRRSRHRRSPTREAGATNKSGASSSFKRVHHARQPRTGKVAASSKLARVELRAQLGQIPPAQQGFIHR